MTLYKYMRKNRQQKLSSIIEILDNNLCRLSLIDSLMRVNSSLSGLPFISYAELDNLRNCLQSIKAVLMIDGNCSRYYYKYFISKLKVYLPKLSKDNIYGLTYANERIVYSVDKLLCLINDVLTAFNRQQSEFYIDNSTVSINVNSSRIDNIEYSFVTKILNDKVLINRIKNLEIRNTKYEYAEFLRYTCIKSIDK